MNYFQRIIDTSQLTKEITFDFSHEKTRVEGDSLFLKIKESEITIEEGTRIVFTKNIANGTDVSDITLRQTFDVLSVEDDVIEILNPTPPLLVYTDITEYTMFDVEMNPDEVFNHLCTDFTNDWHYFIITFDSDYNVLEDKFKLRIRKESNWAKNTTRYFNTYEDLINNGYGEEETFYKLKYVYDKDENGVIDTRNSIIKGPMNMFEYQLADKSSWDKEAIVKDGHGDKRMPIYVKIQEYYDGVTTEVLHHYYNGNINPIEVSQNVVKCWVKDAEHENGGYFYPIEKEYSLTEDAINERLQDVDLGDIQTELYIEDNVSTISNKLQIVLSEDKFKSCDYDLQGCKMDIVHKIDGKQYDDRVYVKECDTKVEICKGVKTYASKQYMCYKLPIFSDHATNVFQETLIKNEYIDETIKNAIPSINDYEKSIVKPYIQRNGANGVFERANKIIFNLHFRDRIYDDGNGDYISETWSTDDEKEWNDSKDGKLKLDKSDLLYYLGFTEDDIYFQKLCLQKSFLRLSFYDSNDPLNQSLLFYSTIFIDTGEVFGLYNLLKTKAIDGDIPGYDEYSDITKLDSADFPSLNSQFVVTDKFDTSKSSEGFYLYLFNKTLPKNIPETIYMKVEFNHAKYGKTIPFLYFTDSDGHPITDTSQIKTNYVLEDKEIKNGVEFITNRRVDMQSYFNDLYIKLNVKYDKETKSHIYYVPYDNNSDTNEIIFNLFEPKING